MAEPKYPDIEVELVGQDGNAFAILGRVINALRRNGVDLDAITAFKEEATAGDYDHLLHTCIAWVEVV